MAKHLNFTYQEKRAKLEVLLGPLSADTLREMLMDIALGDGSHIQEFISTRQAQLSYTCTNCGTHVSPVCSNCGFDPRTGNKA